MKKAAHKRKLDIVLLILILFILLGGMAEKTFHKKSKEDKPNVVLAKDIKDISDYREFKLTKANALKAKKKDKEKIEEAKEVNEVNEEKPIKNEVVETIKSEEAVGKRLNVGLISQVPELYNGCEVTSLAMLLNYKGIRISKLELADKMLKDNTNLVVDGDGNILQWGNPNVGFVGDVTGNSIGLSINPEPLVPLVNQYYSGEALNLTGSTIDSLKASIDNNNPVLVWINENFLSPIEYVSWQDSYGNEIWADMNTHTVLLTGYNEGCFYYNDPLYGYKDASIELQTFETVWNEMGRMALTVN